MTRDGRKIVSARCRGKRLECRKCDHLVGSIDFPDQIGAATVQIVCRHCGALVEIGPAMKVEIKVGEPGLIPQVL